MVSKLVTTELVIIFEVVQELVNGEKLKEILTEVDKKIAVQRVKRLKHNKLRGREH